MLGEQEFADIIRKVSAKSGLTVSHDIDLAYEVLLNHAENKDISEAEPSWLSIGAANQDGQVFHAKMDASIESWKSITRLSIH